MKRRNARKRTGIAALALALLLVAVASTTAAVNARLAGSFDTTATITSGDGPPPPGTRLERTYKFKPLCDKGPCRRVRFGRGSSTGTFVWTVLKKKDPGVYAGKEVQTKPVCADGSKAESRTGRIKVNIVKKNAKGLATKVKGTLKFKIEGCDETFQNSKFVGKR